jgi:hypothetical protein
MLPSDAVTGITFKWRIFTKCECVFTARIGRLSATESSRAQTSKRRVLRIVLAVSSVMSVLGWMTILLLKKASMSG